MSEHRRALTIVNKRGLHARASAKFLGAVSALPGGTFVRITKDGNEAEGGSILGLMMLGAALLALNKRVAGGLVLLLPIFFMLATQDNPMLIPHTKPVPKSSHIRYDDLARHLSLLGGILFLMVVPPVEDAAEENDHGKKKNKKKTN